MSDTEFVHPVSLDDSEAWSSAMALTFLEDPSPDAHPGSAEFRRRVWEPQRTWGARSRDRWVGTLATRKTTLTVPDADGGTLEVPADALTMVTVSATHRRQGVLTRMLTDSLAAARERGDAVAILFAAEWPIYGRFGYAPATLAARYRLDPRSPATGVPGFDVGSVRQVDAEELGTLGPKVFEVARRARAGNIERRMWWQRTLGLDGLTAEKVHGRRPNLFLHEGAEGADGYVSWVGVQDFDVDTTPGRIEVVDLCAASDEAYRALWGYLTGIDLVGEIVLKGRPVDEPVRWLMRDGRALRQDYTGDGVWLRLLDLPAALAGRRYSVEDRLTFEVVDDGFGGYAAGRYTLDGGPNGAACTPSTGTADLRLHERALAGAFLGGFTLREKQIAGLVEEITPGSLRRADAMFTTAAPPWCATDF